MNPVRRPISFVLASSGHGSMIVNRNDYQLDGKGRGFGVGFQLLNSSYFDPDEVSLALQLLELRRETFGSGVIAIDCGANIGVHTIEWAKAMTGWGEVIAFEAQERVFYALAGNVALNNCFNATVRNVAVGARSGSIDVPLVNYDAPGSFGSLELRPSQHNEFIGQKIDYSPQKCKSVPMVAIDSYNLARLDFIKIDVEGMEIEVLDGAEQSIEKHKPMMLIETIKSEKDDLIAFLEGHDYRVFPIGINALAIHQSDPANAKIKLAAPEPATA